MPLRKAGPEKDVWWDKSGGLGTGNQKLAFSLKGAQRLSESQFWWLCDGSVTQGWFSTHKWEAVFQFVSSTPRKLFLPSSWPNLGHTAANPEGSQAFVMKLA